MIPLWSWFFIGCLFGLIVILAARILGKLPLLYGSFNSRIQEVQQAFERFEKWHQSWKSYKKPRQIRVGFKQKTDWLQDPKPDYLKEAES